MGRLKTLQFRMAFLIHPKVHKGGGVCQEAKQGSNPSRGHRALECRPQCRSQRGYTGPKSRLIGDHSGYSGIPGDPHMRVLNPSTRFIGSEPLSDNCPFPFPLPTTSVLQGQQEPDSRDRRGRPRHPSDLDAVSGLPEPQFPLAQGLCRI